MQDDLHRLGDVEANDLRQHSATISEQGVAEARVGGDALSEDRLDLGTGGGGFRIYAVTAIAIEAVRLK